MIVLLLVNDTLLVNESPSIIENGALYQSIAGNTKGRNDPVVMDKFWASPPPE